MKQENKNFSHEHNVKLDLLAKNYRKKSDYFFITAYLDAHGNGKDFDDLARIRIDYLQHKADLIVDSLELVVMDYLYCDLSSAVHNLKKLCSDNELLNHLYDTMKSSAYKKLELIDKKDLFLKFDQCFDHQTSLNTVFSCLKSIFTFYSHVSQNSDPKGTLLSGRTSEQNKALVDYIEFLHAFGDIVEKQWGTDISLLQIGVKAWKTAINLQMYWQAFKVGEYITGESTYSKYISKIKKYEPTYAQPKLKGKFGILFGGIDARDL